MRFMEGRDHGGPLVARSTIMAVFVNGLTTMVGFGSLMLAAHRGIYGLGLMLTLGMLASLVAALIVLPVLLRLFGGKAQRLPRDTRAAETIASAPAS
jgi:predicted RND superfamily exporter protein